MSEETTTSTSGATTTVEEPTGHESEGQQSDSADKPLGEGGKKALQAERERAKAAEQQAAEFKRRLDEIESANLSDLEKAQKEAQDARDLATKATTDALRFRVAAKHGITDDDADLFLTGTDAETLEKQAARLVERTPASPLPDPSQGGRGETKPKSVAEQFADWSDQTFDM